MKYKVRDSSNVIFSLVITVIFVTNLFNSTVDTNYWMIVFGLCVLLIWILIKASKDKMLLLFCVLGMLFGMIIIKLQGNVVIMILGIAVFLIALLFFVFEKSK